MAQSLIKGIRLKNLFALSTALLLTGTLTGCVAANNYACEPAGGGSQVNQISVSSDMAAKPDLSFPSPLTADTVQVKTVVEGNGEVFTGRNLVEFEFAGYNGGSGALVQQTNFDGSDTGSAVLGPDQVPNFCVVLAGAKEGSRVVAIIPAQQAHEGQGIPNLGIGPNDSFIFVFDLKKVYLEKANGSALAGESGMPAVVRDPNGVPGITIPNTAAPTELRIATVIQGSGEAVELGDQVVLHYSGFIWESGEKFQASWDSNQPAVFALVEGQLIDGFLQAVVGQKIGSQVIAVIPPELGYGEAGSGAIPPNSTLIFVIDVLGVSGE